MVLVFLLQFIGKFCNLCLHLGVEVCKDFVQVISEHLQIIHDTFVVVCDLVDDQLVYRGELLVHLTYLFLKRAQLISLQVICMEL